MAAIPKPLPMFIPAMAVALGFLRRHVTTPARLQRSASEVDRRIAAAIVKRDRRNARNRALAARSTKEQP